MSKHSTDGESSSRGPIPWRPKRHHKRGVEWLLKHANAGLFADPGTGKTSMFLKAYAVLKAKRRVRSALLLAPLRPLQLTWPNEQAKWLDFAGIDISYVIGSEKQRWAALERAADIYATNVDNVDWLVDNAKYLPEEIYDLLMVDELHKWKHSNTTRFKALRRIRPLFSRAWGGTGSPRPRNLMDLFGQMFVLDQGNALGPYVTHFRNKYFDSTGYGGYTWEPKEGAEKKIYKAIAKNVLVIEAKDLPPIVENDILVDLPAKAMQTYTDMEDRFVTQIHEEEVTAANAAVASGKLRQIANGAIYVAKNEYLPIHDAKLDALEELVDSLDGQPLFCGYEFAHDATRIMERLGGKDVAVFGGGTTANEARRIEKAWNGGKLRLLLGQPDSVAHGLNLQESGQHVAWFGMIWRWDLYDQFIRRLRRTGTRHASIFVHHIMARDTVDELVNIVLHQRGASERELFRLLQAYAQKRRVGAQTPKARRGARK